MANDSERSSSPTGISGDIIILFVFLLIGGIMFADYVMGLGSPSGVSPTVTRTLTPFLVLSTPIPRLTPTPSVSSTTTALPTGQFSPTTTPLASGVPSLTPVYRYATSTTRPKTTAIKTSTPIPVKSSTLFWTRTNTPTPTVTVTSTVTATITPVNNCATATDDLGLGLPVLGDTWIEAAEPTKNHGSESDTLLSLRADNSGDRRILLQFDLSSLSGSSIVNAKLYFYIDSMNINPTSEATIALYNPAIYWKGKEATWRLAEERTAWTKEGGDYDVTKPIIRTVAKAGCRVQLDITTLVQDWSAGSIDNNGVILIASGPSGEISIPSSRATPIANRPVLLVVTTTPTATVTSTSTTTDTPTVTATVTGTPTPSP